MSQFTDEDRNKLASMAEDIFDMQYHFDPESFCYMLLQHARDCILAVDEISML